MIVRAMRSPYCLRRALVELKILASFLVRKTTSTVESHLIYLIGKDLSVLAQGCKWYLTEGCQAGKTHPAAPRHPSQTCDAYSQELALARRAETAGRGWVPQAPTPPDLVFDVRRHTVFASYVPRGDVGGFFPAGQGDPLTSVGRISEA